MQDSGNIREECIASVEQLDERVTTSCSKGTWLYRGLPKAYGKNLLPAVFRNEAPVHTDTEKALFEDFKRQAKGLVEPCPPSDLDWMALARHHGLPTRVLDWTLNPLVALWFALNPEEGEATTPRVWRFQVDGNDVIQLQDGQYIALPASTNERAIEQEQKAVLRDLFSGRGHAGRTLLYVPEPVSERITAQEGWVMLFATPKDAPPRESENNDRYEVKYWEVCPHSREAIMKGLQDKKKKDRFSLFRDLDNLCRCLKEKLDSGVYELSSSSDSEQDAG